MALRATLFDSLLREEWPSTERIGRSLWLPVSTRLFCRFGAGSSPVGAITVGASILRVWNGEKIWLGVQWYEIP